eukprot:6993002-Prymnesium_polylepis.1
MFRQRRTNDGDGGHSSGESVGSLVLRRPRRTTTDALDDSSSLEASDSPQSTADEPKRPKGSVMREKTGTLKPSSCRICPMICIATNELPPCAAKESLGSIAPPSSPSLAPTMRISTSLRATFP